MQEADLSVNSREWWDDYFRRHWDSYNGSGQTRHFMERLLENLPGEVLTYLNSEPRQILDWGCAQGQGVETLQRAFPNSPVAGLDCSAAALETARTLFPNGEWIHHVEGDIPRLFDVIVCSNTLEHFAHPLEALRRLLAATRGLCIALVPYNEHPLCPFHPAQFREESFPEHVGSAVRVCARVIEVSPEFWKGRQLLVVYAQPAAARALAQNRVTESPHWPGPLLTSAWAEDHPAAAALRRELVKDIGMLVQPGQPIAEVFSGSTRLTAELATFGLGPITLLGKSAAELERGRARLAEIGIEVAVSLADPSHGGKREFDLVVSAGFLEHFSFAERVQVLTGLAGRSRGLVLAVMPNRFSPWYWLSRLRAAPESGREFPVGDDTAAFTALGIRCLGKTYLGSSWTLECIRRTHGLDDACRRDFIQLYESPLLGSRERAAWVAVLGSVAEAGMTAPIGWDNPGSGDGPVIPELAAAVADGLAQIRDTGQQLKTALEQVEQARQWQDRSRQLAQAMRRAAEALLHSDQTNAAIESLRQMTLTETDSDLSEAARSVAAALAVAAETETQLRELLTSRAWKLSRRLRRLKQALAPRGGLRDKLLSRIMRNTRQAV